MLLRKINIPINAKNVGMCGWNSIKKRTGLAIAGEILEIIVGVSWLGYALFTLSIEENG